MASVALRNDAGAGTAPLARPPSTCPGGAILFNDVHQSGHTIEAAPPLRRRSARFAIDRYATRPADGGHRKRPGGPERIEGEDVVKIKRAYEAPARGDGTRVLVDRLWPRGVRRRKAAIDRWAKDLGPSHALRRWFGHDPRRWAEFRRRYRLELRRQRKVLDALARRAANGSLTLVYGARDTVHNNAVVLKSILERMRMQNRGRRR